MVSQEVSPSTSTSKPYGFKMIFPKSGTETRMISVSSTLGLGEGAGVSAGSGLREGSSVGGGEKLGSSSMGTSEDTGFPSGGAVGSGLAVSWGCGGREASSRADGIDGSSSAAQAAGVSISTIRRMQTQRIACIFTVSTSKGKMTKSRAAFWGCAAFRGII